jgi:hypothetical protein
MEKMQNRYIENDGMTLPCTQLQFCSINVNFNETWN